jgi:hypothetical protein
MAIMPFHGWPAPAGRRRAGHGEALSYFREPMATLCHTYMGRVKWVNRLYETSETLETAPTRPWPQDGRNKIRRQKLIETRGSPNTRPEGIAT